MTHGSWRSGAAALFAVLALGAFWAAQAQDETMPAKKPNAKKMEAGDEKSDVAKEKKTTKPNGKAMEEGEDKSETPVDPRQKKWLDRQRKEIEGKFKKSKKPMVYVFSTSETTYEPATGAASLNGGASGGHVGYTKQEAIRSDSREEAVEKVYKFMTEFPPPDPKAKKAGGKKGSGESGTPPPHRTWEFHQAYPGTKSGKEYADAFLDKQSRLYERQNMEQEWKKKQAAEKK